tara:strand:- start:807 stop:1475 length:669 start_codon:yes stop_codon:yes gene_type:complete
MTSELAPVPEASPNPAGRLRHEASELGVCLGDAQIARLLEYAELVRRYNDKFNLVSRRDMYRFLTRHVVDSLSLASRLRPPEVLDIGSGAGLPGLPLAVARADLEFVLLERGARKARFLERAVRTLELPNVRISAQDAREAEGLGGFATIVARAVTSAPGLWVLAEPLLAPGGAVLLMSSTRANPVADGTLMPGVMLERQWVRLPGIETPHEILTMQREATG